MEAPLFILIFSGVWALYSQIWTNIPLYIISLNPAMQEHIEYFQAVDPIMIVCFQALIGKWMGRYRPLPSMVAGVVISAVAVGTVDVGLDFRGLGRFSFPRHLGRGRDDVQPRRVEYVSSSPQRTSSPSTSATAFCPSQSGLA